MILDYCIDGEMYQVVDGLSDSRKVRPRRIDVITDVVNVTLRSSSEVSGKSLEHTDNNELVTVVGVHNTPNCQIVKSWPTVVILK